VRKLQKDLNGAGDLHRHRKRQVSRLFDDDFETIV
jgi:hypothetical protein